jgi:hypothetical protein
MAAKRTTGSSWKLPVGSCAPGRGPLGAGGAGEEPEGWISGPLVGAEGPAEVDGAGPDEGRDCRGEVEPGAALDVGALGAPVVGMPLTHGVVPTEL